MKTDAVPSVSVKLGAGGRRIGAGRPRLPLHKRQALPQVNLRLRRDDAKLFRHLAAKSHQSHAEFFAHLLSVFVASRK